MKLLFQKFYLVIGCLVIIQCQIFNDGKSSPIGPFQFHSVDFFLPLLDTSRLKVSDLRVVASAPVIEDEVKKQYIVYSQTFPTWSDSLEQLWNLFMLESFSIFREELKAGDKKGTIQDLYESIGDRFTAYRDKDIAKEYLDRIFTTSASGVVGIRFELVNTKDTVRILQVAPNSPASRAGLQKQDRILKVNGVSVVGDSAATLFSREIQGDAGTALTFVVKKEGELRNISLVKGTADFPSVLLDTIDGNGVIRIFSFTSNTYDNKSTEDEFIEALRETDGREVTILDLRNNPGGSVNVVLGMCDALLSSGVIIQTIGRALYTDTIPRNFITTHKATPNTVSRKDRKYILLANQGSASAAEIFISALMEGLNIPLVGGTTYGKGIGQVVLVTPDSGVATITFSQTLSRSGQSYNKIGIKPTNPVSDSLAFQEALNLARQIRSLPLLKRSRVEDFDGRKIMSEQKILAPMGYW